RRLAAGGGAGCEACGVDAADLSGDAYQDSGERHGEQQQARDGQRRLDRGVAGVARSSAPHQNDVFKALRSTAVRAFCTIGLVITLYKITAKAQAASVPRVYSTVDMPSSRRRRFQDVLVVLVLLVILTAFPFAQSRWWARPRTIGVTPIRMKAGRKQPASGATPRTPARRAAAVLAACRSLRRSVAQ